MPLQHPELDPQGARFSSTRRRSCGRPADFNETIFHPITAIKTHFPAPHSSKCGSPLPPVTTSQKRSSRLSGRRTVCLRPHGQLLRRRLQAHAAAAAARHRGCSTPPPPLAGHSHLLLRARGPRRPALLHLLRHPLLPGHSALRTQFRPRLHPDGLGTRRHCCGVSSCCVAITSTTRRRRRRCPSHTTRAAIASRTAAAERTLVSAVPPTGGDPQAGGAAGEFAAQGPDHVAVPRRDAERRDLCEAAVSAPDAAVVTSWQWGSADYPHSSLGVPTSTESAHLLVLRLRLRGVCDGPAGFCTCGAAASGAAGDGVQSAACDSPAGSLRDGHVRHHGPRLQRTLAADPSDLHANGPDGPSLAVDPHHLVPALAVLRCSAPLCYHVFIQVTTTNKYQLTLKDNSIRV